MLDGSIFAAIMSAFFLGVLWFRPRLALNEGDYPPDVLAAVPPKTREEKRLAALLGVPFLVFAFGFPLASTMAFNSRAASEASFWVLFAHALGVLAIPFFVDLLFLDWLMFCTITPSFVVIPGTEGFAGYKDYRFHLRAHARGSVLTVVSALVIAALVAAF